MLKKLTNLLQKNRRPDLRPSLKPTNAPQQVDPASLSKEKKTSDLEVLISGQEKAQIRMGTKTHEPTQTQDSDRATLLHKIPNPFRDTT